ncbi:MAG TPA: ABC transporter ATP-binding protein, partial [Limnobacter sp.]|nr:ABC transporter ATP-binding protein [Limnobacter sp.]
LYFEYPSSGFALQVPQFEMNAGDTVFLQGHSGSGKSTFLNLLAGVLKPVQGHVSLMGQRLDGLSASACDALRVDHVGFIFQQFNLLPYLDVLDNVTLPCRFSKRRRQHATAAGQSVEQAAARLLDALGMGRHLKQAVNSLSVGQQQRVAAARALIGQPDLIIADEPTSALDTVHQDRFIQLLMQQASEQNTAVLLVSHNPALAGFCRQTLHMQAWQKETAR